MDTLKAATELAASGFDERQAKALARVLNEFAHEDLATKQDIAGVNHRIDMLGKDLTIRFGAGMIVAVGVILAAMRYLP